MDNTDTINCFNDVKEAFLNTQLIKELALLTHRDIKNTVESWAKGETDKKRVEQMIFEWLQQYRLPELERIRITDENCTLEEKHDLLKKTLSNAKEYMELLLKDNDHGKCDIEEYRDIIESFLNRVLPSSDIKEKRLLGLLKKMGYNFIDDLNGYPYLLFFLIEIIEYEFYLCKEIIPYTEQIRSYKRYKHKPNDEIWIKRLNYYKNIGIRNKHKHAATIYSDRWAIPFRNFAELYRKIFLRSNKAITSPLT